MKQWSRGNTTALNGVDQRNDRSGSGELPTRSVGLEQRTPGHDLRTPLQQRAALAFRHTAPDTELGVVVERVGEALGDHRASHADLLGLLLSGALHEQGIGV